MKVEKARAIAVAWVLEAAATTLGYVGAWIAGSVAYMPAGAHLPTGSDVDIAIVLDRPDLPAKPGKFHYRGILFEATYLTTGALQPLERLLADYHVGNSLWGGGSGENIIDDPSGMIRATQDALRPTFANEAHVIRRCESVRQRVASGLAFMPENAAFHEHLLAWVFPTGVLCHLPLVAALENPTVRRRYVAARGVLMRYNFDSAYEALLHALGCNAMTHAQVSHHLQRLEVTFDAAAKTSLTDLPFATDISPAARTIAIDGSQAMIDAGDHREAVFWIVVTFARCHAVLSLNAPATGERLYPDFLALCSDLGVETIALLRTRAAETTRRLPSMWDIALDIIKKNPGIERGDVVDNHSMQ